MLHRVLALNFLAIGMGVAIAVGVYNTAHANSSSPKASKKVITTADNDYSLPKSSDFKGHEILAKNNQRYQSFDAVPGTIEDPLAEEIEAVQKAKLAREKAEEQELKEYAQKLNKAYADNAKRRQKILDDLKDEIEELDELEITDEATELRLFD